MLNTLKGLGWIGLVWALAGCVPSTDIKQPLTARPLPRADAVPVNNGAIFQPGINERPMFEDRRARNIGDVLTITIVETTAATGKSGHDDSNTGNVAITTPLITSGGNGKNTSYGVAGSQSVKSGSSSDTSGSNTFTGSIAVTVTEVLPNGNLRVAGEKQVAIKHSNEYVRFSGVVNPVNISGSNTVLSTQVADVHVEYKNATSIDFAAVSSMFNRIFFSVLPF